MILSISNPLFLHNIYIITKRDKEDAIIIRNKLHELIKINKYFNDSIYGQYIKKLQNRILLIVE